MEDDEFNPEVVKRFLFVNRKAPYGTVYALESLETVLVSAAFDQDVFRMITPSEYLQEYPTNQMAIPSQSSWGYKGYSEVWVEGANDWLYRHLTAAGDRMRELAQRFVGKDSESDSLTRRAVNQAARELLLAQSSDWPFIMKTGTMVSYAHKRFKSHLNRFTRLYEDIKNDTVDAAWVAELESRDNIYADINCAEFYADPVRSGKGDTMKELYRSYL